MNEDSSRSNQETLKYKARMTNSDQLLLHIEDLTSSLRLSKDLLKELLSQKWATDSSQTLLREVEKNERLEKDFASAIDQEYEVSSKALFNTQILIENQLKYQHKIQELKERIWEADMRRQNKDSTLSELSSKRLYLQSKLETIERVQNMLIEPPTEKILPLHVAVQESRAAMQQAARELCRQRRHGFRLRKECEDLRLECETTRILLSNPINRRAGFRLDESEIGIQKTAVPQGRADDLFDMIENETESKNRIGKMKKEEGQLTQKLLDVLGENMGLLKECEGYSAKYESVVMEIDEDVKMDGLDRCFPSISLKPRDSVSH